MSFIDYVVRAVAWIQVFLVLVIMFGGPFVIGREKRGRNTAGEYVLGLICALMLLLVAGRVLELW